MHGSFILVLLELTILTYGIEVWLWGMIRKMNQKRTSKLVGNNSGKSFLLGLSSQSSCHIPGCHSSPCMGRNPQCFIYSHCASYGHIWEAYFILAHSHHMHFVSDFFYPPHHNSGSIFELWLPYLVLQSAWVPKSWSSPNLFSSTQRIALSATTTHLLTFTSTLILFKTITINNSRGLNEILAFI